VVLPDGGWMTDQTAAAAVSAVTVVWVQRRRRYLPRPPAGAARDDADLAPLPATVAAIQDGLHRHQHPDDDDTDGPDQTGAATPPDPAALESATIGHRAGRAVRPADLPAGGTGLTGEGAPAAARGVIAAVLLAGRSRGHHYPGHDPQVAAIRVVTTASDLAILLGPTATDHHDDTPGLVVADTVDDAIGHLDEAVLHRSQALTAPPHDNAASSPETAGAAAPLVLVTSCPTDSAAARRLAAILRLSTPLGITGVLLGRWPHGPEWRVDPDGTSRPADKPSTVATRLSVLTAGATVDLLTLLREARPRGHRPPPAPPTTSAARQPSDDNPGRPDNPGSRATRRIETPPATVGHDVTPPAGPSPLRLTVLGPPALHHADDLAPVRLARTAALQVLVFLAVHPTGASTARLGAALWPRIRPDTAAGSVYTAVRSLRNALPAGVDVIVRDGERYRLDARHVDVDLWRLHEAVNNAATALDPHARRRALRAVVDGYTGELASDQPWPWLAAHREGVRRHVVDAQAALAAAHPDPHAALAMLQDAIRIDPLNEELHRRAMRGYAAAGNPTAVRHLLTRLTDQLAAADLEPDDATRDLGRQLAVGRDPGHDNHPLAL
jgi:DNA-binding SARP family transcriptional activator